MTYDEFINNIIETRGQWGIPLNEYFEAHHIIPRCMGGDGECFRKGKRTNDKNIIWLYPKEHFIAHKLLCEENPDNKSLLNAWMMMAFPKGKCKRDFEISPEEYESLRIAWSTCCKGNNNFLSYDGHPWNYGLTKETDIRLKEYGKRVSSTKLGVKLGPNSEETKIKKSLAQRKRYLEHPESFVNHNKGMTCITNGVENKYIDINTTSIPDGFIPGMTKKEDVSKYIESWDEDRRKKQSIQNTGSGNPMYGKGYKLKGGNNGKAIYIYTFENKDYYCRDDLIIELKKQFSTISESTIRRIMSGNYTSRISNKYQYVIDNLSWRLKSEDKKYKKN